MQFVETLRTEIQQLIRVNFDAAIRRGGRLVSDLLSEFGLLDTILIEQERTHRRGAYIKADDEGHPILIACQRW